jgi:hypothetical protein
MHKRSASFDTRRSFASALLRMSDVVDGIKSFPHPERERSSRRTHNVDPASPQ